MVIEEGVLAADEIAEAAEDERAEGTHQEAAAKASSAKTLRVVTSKAEKNCAPMIDGERAVEIEVVPFEDGAERTRPG